MRMEKAEMVICEICGEGHTSYDDIDICESCRKPAKTIKTKKAPATKIEVALKRVMKGQNSRAITNLRECRCEIEKVLKGGEETGTRIEDLVIEGIKVYAYEMTEKTMVVFEKDSKIFSGYYE